MSEFFRFLKWLFIVIAGLATFFFLMFTIPIIIMSVVLVIVFIGFSTFILWDIERMKKETKEIERKRKERF